MIEPVPSICRSNFLIFYLGGGGGASSLIAFSFFFSKKTSVNKNDFLLNTFKKTTFTRVSDIYVHVPA